MKKMKFWSSLMLIIVLVSFVTACGDDEDTPVSLNSYIVGNWHSFKFSSTVGQNSGEGAIDKTGAYSQLYYEMSFKNDGKMSVSYWKENTSGISSWVTESSTYIVNGNSVTISDGEGSMDLYFDSNQKLLYARVSTKDSTFGVITVYVYFRK